MKTDNGFRINEIEINSGHQKIKKPPMKLTFFL